MFTWPNFVALILAVFALISVMRGHIDVGGEGQRTTVWIQRSEKPVQFWTIIAVLLALAAFFFVNPLHF